MLNLVLALYLILWLQLPICAQQPGAAQPSSEGTSEHQTLNSAPKGGRQETTNTSAAPVPNIYGTWQGEAVCGDQTFHVRFGISQTGQSVSGTLTSTGDGGTSIHHVQGTYNAATKQFVCEDISVDKLSDSLNLTPVPVHHYEFRLADSPDKLLGSGYLEPDTEITFSLLRLDPSQALLSATKKAQTTEASGLTQALVGPGSTNSPTDNANQACSLCRQGRQLRDANNLEVARQLFVQACTLDPNINSAVVHDNLGYTLMMMGDLKTAIAEFNKALSFQPDMPSATINLAECYKEEGELDQAMSYYKRFISEHPDSPQVDTAKALLRTLRAAPKVRGDAQDSDYLDSVTQKGTVRWPQRSMPISVYVDAGTGVYGYRDSFRQIVFHSLSQWREASHAHLTWRPVSDPSMANLTFSWTSSREDFPHGAEQGQTKLVYRGHCIEKAQIKICTVPIASSDSKPLSDSEMAFTCLHEIGHAFGLEGHSPNNNDVMFFSLRPNPLTQLTIRDRTTIARLYSASLDERPGKNKMVIGIPGLFGLKF